MQQLYSYETVTEAVSELRKRGYTEDLNIPRDEDCLYCQGLNMQLSPDEFEIDETYRFEGDTDPGDEMIVFAVSSESRNIKGVLVNAYGMYSDSHATQIIERLKPHL